MTDACLWFVQINRGDYEGEVLIFGRSDVQQKANDLIKELIGTVTANGPGFHYGKRKAGGAIDSNSFYCSLTKS